DMKIPASVDFTLPPWAVKVGWRPLLFVAGAAAATAGAYYVFFYRSRDRQRRPTTEETTVQTLPEDLVQRLRLVISLVELRDVCSAFCDYASLLGSVQTEVITEENGQLMVSPQYCGPVTEYRCPRRFLLELILQLCFKELQSSFWTLRFSYTRWHHRGQQIICVRRHYVLLMRGARTYSYWIITNDFFMSSTKCPIWYASAARVTVAECVEGLLTRVASCMFTEHRVPKTSGGVQVMEVYYTHQSLIIRHEWSHVATSWSEVLSSDPNPQPEPSTSPCPQPGSDAAGQDTSEAAGGTADVAREVPALHVYTEIKGIHNVPLKLNTLRQAFTTILSDANWREDACETGRTVLGNLATLNGRDLNAFHQAYDQLLGLVQDPFYREGIEAELAQIGIQHFNFLDIVYEVVMLGIQAGARPQICPMPGGFLDHLLVMISSFSATTLQSRPRAEQYQLLLQNEMMHFLEDIFTLEECVYEAPESVAEAVWDLVEKLLDRLEDLA
ncbi:hypothetical protein NFI96_026861, partial [Prochilodus magdalenae]